MLARDAAEVRRLVQAEGASLEEGTLVSGWCSGDSLLMKRKVMLNSCMHAQDGLTALHVAAAAGHADMVGVLARAGRRLRRRHAGVFFRLFLASAAGACMVVLEALTHLPSQDGCDTALHLAAVGGGLNAAGRQECLEVLLGALGAAPDLPNRQGRTPLHVAAQTGNMPALAALLAAGAHRASQDREGRRPVDLAAAAAPWRRWRTWMRWTPRRR